tara:strand:+ start:191 stop:766 length:576 start_codon:yes stop_codon:yes gene_type:complete
MPRLKDLTGKTFHDLTVKSRAGSNRQGLVTWLCECACGKEKVYSSDHLTRKKSPVKSCGCLQRRSGKDHHQWGGCGEISGNWFYNHVLRERKTKRTRVPVTVTIEDVWELFLKQGRKCALSGVGLDIASTGKYNTASIDRIDSSKGYEMGNIQWVHKHINFMKRTYSQEYFIEMCSKVATNSTLTEPKNKI